MHRKQKSGDEGKAAKNTGCETGEILGIDGGDGQGREQGHTQREQGGLEQEGEESFDAWREMQHKGNRGTNNLRGFHHLGLN